MERTPCKGRCFFLAVILFATAPCSWSSADCCTCSAVAPDCARICEASGACLCNKHYGRCACQNKEAALLEDGRCIASSPRVQSGHVNCSKNGELGAAVLFAVGTTPSPEMSVEDVIGGQPSPAMSSILHWCAASAMGVSFDEVQLAEAKFISNTNISDHGGGLLFFDVSFVLCASGVTELVAGGLFERRFVQAWQNFAAFPIASVKLLELRKHPSDALDEHAGTVKGARSQPPDLPSGSQHVNHEVGRGPTLKQLLWIGPAVGVALLLLTCATIRLARLKYKNAGVASPRHWGEVAPGAHLQDHQLPQAAPQGSGGGFLASVAYDFDPNSTDGSPFVVAAGLDTTECLTASKGDLFEAFARGEDWLYGRLSSSGLFGYLPEPCVLWVDGVGGAPSADALATLASAGVAPRACPQMPDTVMGRPATPISLAV